MAFTYITLTAGSGYRMADGSVPNARIRATPYVEMVNGTRTVNQEVIVPLNSAGTGQVAIAATTDPSTTPTGNAYRFTVEANGYPTRTFIAALPHNTGSSVSIDSLTPLALPPDFPPIGGAAYTDEQVRDVIGAALVAGSNVTITPNDGADTITIAAATSGASGIPASTVDVKGDLIAGTANDTVARLAAGADGLALVAASGATTGLQWAAPAPAAHVHPTTDITTGTMATARLGAGAASSSTFLRGDQTWAVPAGGSSASTVSGIFNAKLDFLATGNGSTNDATALQNALTAAGAAGGGIVYLPPGTYMTAKYLTIPSNVTLMGAGMGVTTIKATSTLRSAGGVAPDGGGYSVLQATGVSRANIAIQDLTVDGNESADRTALAASGLRLNSYLIDIRSVTGLRIERVATRNTWTYNIGVIDCSQFVVTGCDIRDPGTTGTYNQLDGIHIWGSNKGRIIGNYVDNGNGGDADDAMVAHVFPGGSPCYDLVYAHNVCRGGTNGHGIQLAGASGGVIRDITISNNVFWQCVGGGMRLNFYSASSNQPIRSVTLANNTFRDSTVEPPIRISADNDGKWEDITIAGNTIDGYGTAGAQFVMAIAVEGGNASRGIAITGNNIRNGYCRAISMAARDYVIANNVIDTTAATVDPVALILSGSIDGSVSGNIITGRSSANGLGIYMESPASPVATNQTITGNRIRAFNTGVSITNSAGANPTNTLFVGNNTQGNGSGTGFGTATVTSANNL